MKNKILICFISLFFLLFICSINLYATTDEVDKIENNVQDIIGNEVVEEINSDVLQAPIQYNGVSCLDSPGNNQSFTRPDDAKMKIRGWAVSDDRNSTVKILIDGNVVINQAKRVQRGDVDSIISPQYGGVQNTPLAGFEEIVDISGLTAGTHTLKIEQISRYGNILSTNEIKINVQNKKYNGVSFLDSPGSSQSFTRPDDAKMKIRGWAVSDDRNSTVKISIDGNVVLNQAKRVQRGDVDSIISPQYGGVENTPLAGFEEIVDISGLTAGTHILKIEQFSRYGNILSTNEIKINVQNKKYNGVSFLDSPGNNQSFTRPDDVKMKIRGWAVSDDRNSTVKISIDGNVVLNQAKRVQRGDVDSIISPQYGGVQNTPLAGFEEIVDISGLTAGTHTLKIEQISRYGNILSTNEIKINVQNKKYNGVSFLDRPGNNQSFTRPDDAKMKIRGWAVSDDRNSTVKISIDGNVVINQAKRVQRGDVDSIISPQYGGVQNTPLAGFEEIVDISGLTAGTHTLKIEQVSRYGNILSTNEIKINVQNKKYNGVSFLDSPGSSQSFTRPDDAKMKIRGWAVSDDRNSIVKISIDGNVVINQAKRVQRGDVDSIISPQYGGVQNTPLAGFEEIVDISGLTAGTHTLKIEQISRYGEIISLLQMPINIVNKKYNGEMCVDVPTVNTVYEKEDRLTVAGWAVSEDTYATVDVYIDNVFKSTTSRYVRPDVAYYVSKFGEKTVNPGFGIMLSCSGLSAGSHKLTVYQKSRYGDIISGIEVKFIVKQANNNNNNQNQQSTNNNISTNSNINTSGTKGIDVSQYQGNIDWQKVANSGIKYVMIRIGYRGYGTGGFAEDPKFKTNFANAVASGLKVGVYFYSTSVNSQEAKADADYVVKILRKYGYENKVSMPVAIDLELISGVNTRDKNVSKTVRTDIANTFCSTISNYGYKPMVYACKSFLNSNMNASQVPYDIWVAQYNSKCTYNGKYTIWQYTSSGKVSGISGNVDCNICYKNY